MGRSAVAAATAGPASLSALAAGAEGAWRGGGGEAEAGVEERWTPELLGMAPLLDPGQFIMERKWLLGVKERAEAAAGRPGHAWGAPPVLLPR